MATLSKQHPYDAMRRVIEEDPFWIEEHGTKMEKIFLALKGKDTQKFMDRFWAEHGRLVEKRARRQELKDKRRQEKQAEPAQSAPVDVEAALVELRKFMSQWGVQPVLPVN